MRAGLFLMSLSLGGCTVISVAGAGISAVGTGISVAADVGSTALGAIVPGG